MSIIAEIAVRPWGVMTWVALGLLVGWLAGRFLDGAYGRVADVVFGLAGALAGGFLHGMMRETEMEGAAATGFWASLPVAILGACVVLGMGRVLSIGRRT